MEKMKLNFKTSLNLLSSNNLDIIGSLNFHNGLGEPNSIFETLEDSEYFDKNFNCHEEYINRVWLPTVLDTLKEVSKLLPIEIDIQTKGEIYIPVNMYYSYGDAFFYITIENGDAFFDYCFNAKKDIFIRFLKENYTLKDSILKGLPHSILDTTKDKEDVYNKMLAFMLSTETDTETLCNTFLDSVSNNMYN